MVIRVLDIAGGADSHVQGDIVHAAILRALSSEGSAVVSFAGIDIATSSFINTSLLPILDMMTFDALKARLRVVDSTRQINDMIRHRLGPQPRAAA